MSSHHYYQERLGLDPTEARANGTRDGKNTGADFKTFGGYEESLSKFKDERDAIQKKTFTKWVNKHLKKAGKQVRDLFEDLRDGHNLISLLEVLSGEHLPRERGRLRFHMLQNVQLTLDFLRYRKIKLVNIRCEDIVDGNPKLTLGLIWTIILHFQISDIMAGQTENLTAKEALLRWARKTTYKYPGVEVKNFTTSWRDGLSFVAIIHRNRPDLMDWRNLRQRTPRERLETAFHVMEREYGVTRLLDPEDVDTPEPDEKSLITYVSQLYEIFPEPPSIHPLFNIEAQRKLEEYREMATTLLYWIREHISIMKDRHFPTNTVELKRMAHESTRFRQEEVPPRLRDKNSCQRLYRDIQKLLDGTGFLEEELTPELHYNNVDSEWNKLMSLYQERDDALHDSLSGADRLQRLAEKVHREIKQTEITLEEVEVRIEDEARRVERLHPMDAKRNCDALDGELAQCEDTIKTLHSDVKVLREGKYHEAPTLHKRVVKLEERYVSVRTLFENRLLIVLNNRSFTQQESYTTTKRIVVSESRLVETNEHFRFLQECINWCKDKLKKLNDSEYGNDLAAVEKEYDTHQKEHKIIHQFHTNVDQCAAAENNFNGEEHTVYINLLSQLRKTYAELLSLSNKRVSDLHSLLDFLQAATQELIWLNEKEEQELNRDWANKSLNISDVERYYEKLMGDLEKREVQFSAVQDRGNSLVIGHHPASKTVEAYLAAMQTQWQWLLELTLCLETHLQHAAHYHTFFTDISNAEQWIMAHDEKLNTTFSVTDFGLDDGEQLLREMQDMRESLAQFNTTVDELINRSKSVVPLKQRRQTLRQPTAVTAICNYKKMDMSINKGERCTVHDNSNRVKWNVVTSSGARGMVPGVCFTIPPPNQEAIDAAEKLKRQYERCIALWQKKQLRMRQNMIFATIKVVKSWDLAQFIAMGADQRNAIRRALNEDAEKLLQEGDPNDPQLRRLKREIDEVNRLFDEFERRASEPKPGAVLVEQCNSLKEYLDLMEKMLIQRCLAGIPRDLDLLEQLVIEHKQFENDLSSRELEVESIQKNYQNLSRRTPAIQRTVESITQQWDRIWALSHVYIERMKCVEMVVTGIEEGTQVVSEIELKLAEHQDLPDDLDDLEKEHQELLVIQQTIHDHQALIDRLLEECRNVRTLVVKSRPSQKIHPDVDKLEEDVRKLRIRWENMCSQIIERLRSCEAACELLTKYHNGHNVEKREINHLEDGLRMQKIEDLGPSEAELELERLRQAMIEKYRQCDTTIVEMVDRVSEIERRLAEQEPVSENGNGLRNQINTVKAIKDELDEMFRPLGTCLDAVRQVVNQGGDVLSREELASLDQAATSLKQRYDHCVVQADTTHRRLTTAMEEFSKYEKEIALFETWLKQANKTLVEKERLCSDLNKIKNHEQGCRDFLGDVIAHQADLRFITMATQKFLDESSLYLRTVNNFRTTLPERYPLLQADPDSMVRDAADEVSAEFKGLLARANKLVDKATSVGNKQRDYTEAIEKASRWLKDTEVKVTRILQEPVGAEPKIVQDQLDKAKVINNDVVAQSRLFDNCRATATSLLRALEGELTPHEQADIEQPPEELAERYAELAERLGHRCQELDTALVQCQGVQEGLDSLMNWLNNIDLQLKSASKPASLNRDRLDEQLREHRQLHADIMSHQVSVVRINDSAEALLTSASNARVAKKIETKLRELNTKFEKVVEKSETRGQHLENVSTQLDAFTVSVEHFEEWYIEIVEVIESREVLALDIESYARKIDEISRQRDSRSDDFDGMIRTGKELVTKKDVTDTAPVKDKIKNLEGQWKELNDVLDERARNGKERSEQLLAYEQLRDRCIQWLTTTENMLDNAQPVGLEQDIVKKQTDDLKPILKEYREYGTTIDRLNELGNAYDALLRGERPESPTRRRSSVTPVKRPSITSPLKSPVRRVSQDARGSSPSHKLMGFNGSGPMSPIPGGYASRRTSQEGFHLDDMSPIQKELMQVNNRYDMIGMRLTDRQNDLDLMKDELKKLADSMRSLTLVLDKAERTMPREVVPTTKEEADKYCKQCKTVLEDLLEKQPALDSLKVQVVELIKKRPTAPGAHVLQDQVDLISDRFKELQGRLKDRLTFLDQTKDFLDSYDSLSNWLNSKDRMMTVLGPIASDPRMVQMQAQQVQVLREEFQGQEPKLGDLNDAGDNIIAACEPNSMAAKKMNDKLDSINNKWTELIGQLDARDSALNAASNASTDFYDKYNKLHDTLLKLGDDFDEVTASGADSAMQIEAVNNMEKGLQKARADLIDLEGLGEQLISILSDASSKSDIKAKITQLNRMFNNLEKKLGNRKSELEASLRDEEEFGQSCQDIQEWLADQVAHLKDQLLVSADRDILGHQVSDFEPIYKDLMAKEHEVIRMINKGKDIVAKSSRKDLNRQLTATLDAIKKEWDNVRKTAVDRRTRLQNCMDTCNKFHTQQDRFNPWLDKAEEKARSLEPIAFEKRAIDKQVKEIQSFKNEVSRHSGEYENNRTAGDKLISCTDTDHEGVHDAVGLMKERWDHLNAIVFARAQDLEDVAARLADFNDKARDLDHTLQRCGDKLASLDALAGTGKDAKSLERMKALLDETDALGKQVDQVKNKGEDLCVAADSLGSDANHIQDEVERLSDRYGDLRGKLEERCHDLEEASQAVNQFGALVKNVGQELSALDDELDRMAAVGRDIKTVTNQTDQLHSFMAKVDSKVDEINDAKAALDDLVSQGFTNANNRTTEDQIKQLERQCKKIQDRCDARNKDLESVMKKLENFYDKYSNVVDDINETDKEGESFKPVGADVDTIIAQQEEFKRFKGKKIEALGKQVAECNKLGQGLIQSAASGVNTQALENDIDKLNDIWNKLKEMIGDREKALDKGLMQSGKFQDALDSMLQWLANFEEMMANQAPISGEYSVVKAQAQEQKFLRKMLLDRQNEMQALLSMGRSLAADLEPSEKAVVEGQLDDLLNRFDDAGARSQERMEALEETLKIAKEFQNKLNPITEWLDRTEKKLKEMSVVPSDEAKIQKLLNEHDNLHDEILGQKPAFDDLTDVATALMSLIGDDEANALADKLQATTDRYGQLVEDSEALGRLLQESKVGLRHLVLTYEDLLSWMDEMEARLSKYRVLSVFVEKLLEQMDELTDLGEEVVGHEKQVGEVMDAGSHLMKHISSDEALQLKDKLDSIHRRYNDLSAKATDLHKAANEALPLVQQFHSAHDRLGSWMLSVEGQLQSIDTSGQVMEEEIERLAQEIQEHRPLVEAVNLVGPQLCQISPGEGASNIETLVTRDNRRFEQICEQIQRRMERIHMSKQRSQEVTQDIDELLGWFREVEGQIREAEPPSVDPEEIRIQLKEHKALNDDVASQKGRVRDVLSNAKKVLRESPHHEDTSELREKMDDLKETMELVSKLSSDRLSTLEQALPLAEHFFETHHELDDWLTAMENEAMVMDTPALRADQIIRQMEKNKNFLQSIGDHKPLLDKLNKTGGALLKLVNSEDGLKIQELLESDNERYNALKYALRERSQALEDALQETSQFSDKLDGMLSALAETADQVKNAEPISAHPEKIHEQVQENNGIIDDLERKESAFAAVKAAAEDVINKASRNDPAVKDIKSKLDRLNKLWDMVQMATTQRGQSLEDALAMAEKFWDELQNVMAALKDLQETLKAQEPVAVEPQAIKQQREELSQIKNKIDQTKPEVEQVRQTGRELITLVGDADKPEVKKNIEDLDYAWDNVTALYAKREENLIDAMEKAMEFHDTLRNMLEFLEKAEDKFNGMGAIAGDIEAIKGQIKQLQKFKDEVDPHMVKVEALNRQAQELRERTSPDQAAAIMEPLGEVNHRWDELLKGIVERQRNLEYALLKLGQFQHALKELLVWIERTTKTVSDLKPVFGDPQVIEVELAKLKVTINDIQAHQSSVDTLNDAGRQLIEADKGSEDASNTQQKLGELNKKWTELQDKANGKQSDLENALREAQIFSAEIQDLLLWLGDIDAALSSSKPVGGLPETAKEQLLRFMEIYDDLEENRSKVEGTLQQGQEYLKRSREGAATNLNHSLRTLKQRWESVMNRANDKKIKLEIALKEATEFHDALQIFVDWLTEAENLLNNQQPVSRVLDIILQQIEEHNNFKKDVTAHREVMLSLDKKGTHLKYFSQKQDVILIKNLLVSVQHRWEKVVSKAAERTRALDLGFKEAKDFHENWNELVTWLDDAETSLDDLAANVGNDPEKIKAQIAKHKEFQRALGAKQPSYDSTMKQGKGLQNKAPKTDEETLKQMLTDLKNKWNSVCQKSVDRQRKLEEALLFTGQFKDATQALLDWLKKVEMGLVDDGPVHGDLDTVMALVEQHKAFCAEMKNRSVQVDSVRRTADELLVKASAEDASIIQTQVTELVTSWERVERATDIRTKRLEEALQAAEQLHKVVHMLLDWLSDAEMKLRYAGPLPDSEDDTRKQIAEHEAFMAELNQKEREKDDTIALAEDILAKAHPDGVATIKHWITIIQSRWEEVMAWARQRETRLSDHLRSLRDLAGLLDELMRWLVQAENNLTVLEAEPLPDDIPAIEGLIADHKEFMDEMQKKEPDVLSICKPSKPRPSLSQPNKKRSRTSLGRESVSPGRESSPDYDYPSRRSSRISPDRESSPGPKSRKSSRSSPAREVTPTREYPRPWMYGARTTPPRETSPGADRESDWPLGNLRFVTSTPTPSSAGTPAAGGRKSSKASVREEPQIKNPQARALWEKWQHVGFMAWERMRRLHDKLNYLHELEKLKNFSWEEWRKRFMKFMNHKKSRVTDLFRKMDADNDGAVPRDDFIDGILKTKFPTSRLEMGTVADIFDRNQDGYIDYQEFIAALRPDWERKGPLTDAELIEDEVQKQVSKCTCRQKFRVHQVGEGKYRFGDSQKLRLVRILRSTVMVRVGGGWVALDEFLVKNDPCRAKGRTNVELREQFILAEGVSQSMTPFKSKPSPNSSVSSQSGTTAQQRSQSLPNSGPIIKVRERTAKSSAMGRASFSAGTPDSSFSEEGGSSGFHLHGGKRKASAPVTSRSSYNTSGESQPGSRGGSRPQSRGPGSRPGSRPPSRAGSEVSLDSNDGGRTPMRRTPSFTGRTRTPSSQSSGVQRSSSLRKASAPVKSSTDTVNGTGTRTISVSSRLYSPTLSSRLKEAGIRTNLSGSASNLSVAGTPLRSRTSSTTSLNSNHSTSKIPTLRPKTSGTHITPKTSTTRTRTPSGSSSTGGTTRIIRKGSGASDTPTGVARKTGIMEPKRRV